MIRFFRVSGRVLGWLLRTRALRPVLAVMVLVWILDGFIGMATDGAWFSSVGMASLWRQQMTWVGGVGTVFVMLCLTSGILLMRSVARPVEADMEEPLLPRALERWQPLRERATRWGWLVIVAAALLLGRDLSAHWSEFALASAGSSSSNDTVADFWLSRAPALASVLAASWKFSLVLGAVALGTGVLRALPFLAARPSVRPRRWLRALWVVGAALCVLRALGFVFESLRHAHIVDEGSVVRVGFVALNVAGALACLVMALLLRRPRPKLGFGVAAILLIPALGGDLLAPFARPEGRLFQTPPALNVSDRIPDDWPQWDEAPLLRAARLHLTRDNNGHFIEWQSAGTSNTRDGRGARADVVGTALASDAWVGHGLASEDAGFVWQSLDLPQQKVSREGQPIGPLFYGLNARPLLSNDARDRGAPFQEWYWKLAWSWRLRDPILLFEGARLKRLIMVRGAREVGHKLAPFWTWDEAIPRRDAKTGSAYFECVAYQSTSLFPRRAPFQSGIFAGQNAISPVAVLRLDARSGALQLAPIASPHPSAPNWKAVVPSLFNSDNPQNPTLPALETALAGATPLIWTRTVTGWQKQALPLELREPVEKKLDEFARLARTQGSSSLEGVALVMWRENGQLLLAQSFFDFADAAKENIAPSTEVLPSLSGFVVGPLNERGARWNATFVGARKALVTPDTPPSSSPSPTPSTSSAGRSTSELAQAARETRRAASEAIKKGNYTKWQKLDERVGALLEEITHRAR